MTDCGNNQSIVWLGIGTKRLVMSLRSLNRIFQNIFFKKEIQRGVKSNTPEYKRKINVLKIFEDSADVFV